MKGKNESIGWEDYAEERASFPKAGETDTFFRDRKPTEDPQFQGKLLVRTAQRTLSLFPKQLKLIAREFKDNPKLEKVSVDWIHDADNERHVIPIIQGKL